MFPRASDRGKRCNFFFRLLPHHILNFRVDPHHTAGGSTQSADRPVYCHLWAASPAPRRDWRT